MNAPLAIALAALLTVVGAAHAIATVQPQSITWPMVLLGIHPILAVVLLVAPTGMGRLPAHDGRDLCPCRVVVLLAILLGVDDEPLPNWAVPMLLLGTIAGVVALVAGTRFLRGRA